MAIVGGQDDDELNPNPGQPISPSGASASGGAGGYIGGNGGTGATTKAGTSAAPTSSGNYTNLTSYLQANQDSGATAGKAAENVVDQSANAAKDVQDNYGAVAGNDIAAASSGLGVDQSKLNAINSGASSLDPSQMDKIKSGVATADKGTLATISKAGMDAATNGGGYKGPESFNTNYSGPKSIDAGYKGPNDGAVDVQYGGPQNYGALTGNAAALQTAALGANQQVAGNAAAAQGGQAGVAGLLRSAYQQPKYTQGENNLDSFLAGGTQGGQAALGQAKGVNDQVQGRYGDVNANLTKQINSAQDTAAVTNLKYGDAIKAAIGKSKNTQADYDATIANASNDQTAKNAYTDAVKAAKYEASTYSPQPSAYAMPDFATSAQNIPVTKPGTLSVETNPNDSDGLVIPGKGGVTKERPPLVGGLDDPGNIQPGQVAIAAAHGGRVPSYSKLQAMLRK